MSLQWRYALGDGMSINVNGNDDTAAVGLSNAWLFRTLSRGEKVATVKNRSTIPDFHRLAGIELPLKHHFVPAVTAGISPESLRQMGEAKIRRLFT